MITVEEIKLKANNLYTDVLRAAITGESIFPKSIRSNKTLPKDFAEMNNQLKPLVASSKDIKGFGYTIQYKKVNTRLHGSQHIPDAISFDNLDDYLNFIGKKKEYTLFVTDLQLILNVHPELKAVLLKTPSLVITNHSFWPELLKVCHWFQNSHEPNQYYIRELPIAVHTKFIEGQQSVLRVLFDALIGDRINAEEKGFEKRYSLKYAEPLVRLRALDKSLFIEGRFTDISAPLSEFAANTINCDRIIITENKMNFLTLPPLPGTVAIWGGGFAIENLKNIDWLKGLPVYYWGDLDEHGMQILSQLRKYYPQTISFLMDLETLRAFEHYWDTGAICQAEELPFLSSEEHEVFIFLKSHSIRLEQEKIPQHFVDERLKKLYNLF